MKRIDWLGVGTGCGGGEGGGGGDAEKEAGRPVRSLLHQSRREPNGGLGSYGNGDGKRVLTGWRVVQGWGGGRS